MRTLTTIGNLRAQRSLGRAARMRGLYGLYGMGATSATFVAPTAAQLAAEPVGSELAGAAVAMLQHFQTDGVPSEHVSDPFVLTFQQAFNKDGASWVSHLDEDGGYGPNVHDAAAALAARTPSLVVPPVNYGTTPAAAPPVPAQGGATPAPSGGGGTTPAPSGGGGITPAPSGGGGVTPLHPAVVAHAGGSWVPWAVLLVVVGGVSYGVARWAKKRKGGKRRKGKGTTIKTSRALVLA